jgi:hypothetical protein
MMPVITFAVILLVTPASMLGQDRVGDWFVFANGTSYVVKPDSVPKPHYMEDMAMCGETIDGYATLSETAQELGRRKQNLNATNPRRRAEQSKWSWLDPDILDLAALSTLFGCHSTADLVRYLHSHGYDRSPPSPIRNALALFVGMNGREYRFLRFRRVDETWGTANHIPPQDAVRVVWVSTYYTAGDRHGSEEYWIDTGVRKYQYLSDYWLADWRGFTTPEFRVWRKIDERSELVGTDGVVRRILELFAGN